jgi:hypothetical protein
MSQDRLEQFKKYGKREITLSDGLVVEIQNPSLLRMVQEGKIPNPLLPVAAQLLGKKPPDKPKDEKKLILEELKYNADVIEIYLIAALVNPRYEEVKDFLTDRHKTEIVMKAKEGVEELANFSEQAIAKESSTPAQPLTSDQVES